MAQSWTWTSNKSGNQAENTWVVFCLVEHRVNSFLLKLISSLFSMTSPHSHMLQLSPWTGMFLLWWLSRFLYLCLSKAIFVTFCNYIPLYVWLIVRLIKPKQSTKLVYLEDDQYWSRYSIKSFCKCFIALVLICKVSAAI